MEYGIQRRNIYLAPPDNEDLQWLFDQFEREEIWEAFGFDRTARMPMLRAFRSGDTVTGIIYRVDPRKRIGLVLMFPPDDGRDYWEFSYAIPEVEDRDAFSAFNTTDAMAHYMFDHLKVDKLGWRVWEDNLRARAVIRRLGYQPNGVEKWVGDRKQIFYELPTNGWAKRRTKLEKGEVEYPSGTGGAFVTLTKPFTPIVPTRRVEEPVEEAPAPSRPEKAVVAKPAKMPKKKASAAAPGAYVAEPTDAEIQATIQSLSRRDIYAPLGYDRSASTLFMRAMRRKELELKAIRLKDGDHWIGFAVVVPPASSPFRRYEIDLSIVRLRERTPDRQREVAGEVFRDFFAADPKRKDAIVPVEADAPWLIELAEDLGLRRVPNEELSPLVFRRGLDTVAFSVERADWT